MNKPLPIKITLADTVAEAIEYIENCEMLSDRKRTDLASDLRTVARLLGRHPSEVQLDVPTLRKALQNVRPGVHRISSKRFTNVRSNFAHALRLVRVLPRKRRKPEKTDEWREFWERISDQHLKARVTRFIDFCLVRGLDPADVTDATVAKFRNHLERTSLYQEPKKIADDFARVWNRLNKQFELGLAQITVSNAGRYITPKIETYPESFQEDLNEYLDVLRRPNLFDEKAPAKPLRSASLVSIESCVRQVLSAAINNGYEPAYFKDLSNLVEESVIDAAFTWLTARNGGEHPVGLRDLAAALVNIAKHHVRLPEDSLSRLRSMRRLVASYDDGMSEKNRRRLEQFDDFQNTRALLTLPDRLMERSKQKPGNVIAATDALYGAAIAILLVIPMRMKNLAALDLEKHLTVIGKGSGRKYRIFIPSDEVKNGVPIEAELLGDEARFVDHYLDKARHILIGEPTTAFFPSHKGGPRPSSSLGYGIGNIIKKETGLAVHPHLFRHITAKLYLEAHHGDYESVRRQLGHKKYDTTLKFYATFDNKRAQERYAKVILEAKKPRKPKR